MKHLRTYKLFENQIIKIFDFSMCRKNTDCNIEQEIETQIKNVLAKYDIEYFYIIDKSNTTSKISYNIIHNIEYNVEGSFIKNIISNPNWGDNSIEEIMKDLENVTIEDIMFDNITEGSILKNIKKLSKYNVDIFGKINGTDENIFSSIDELDEHGEIKTSYEFQDYFLSCYPEKYNKIKTYILPDIKKKYPDLADADELGLL